MRKYKVGLLSGDMLVSSYLWEADTRTWCYCKLIVT